MRELAPRRALIELGENLGLRGRLPRPARRRPRRRCCSSSTPTRVPAPGCLDALRAAAGAQPGWGAWQALVTLPGGRASTPAAASCTASASAGRADTASRWPQSPRRAASRSASPPARRWSCAATRGTTPAASTPTYFMYGEDLDLSLRLRLAGWGVGMVPGGAGGARVRVRQGRLQVVPPRAQPLVDRARRLPRARCLRCAPRRCSASSWRCSWSPRAAAGCVPSCGRSCAVLRTLPWALRRRRRVQARRRTSPAAFAAALTAALDSPYLGAARPVPAVRALQAGYWRAVRGSARWLTRCASASSAASRPRWAAAAWRSRSSARRPALEARGHSRRSGSRRPPRGRRSGTSRTRSAPRATCSTCSTTGRGSARRCVVSPVIVASPGLDEAAVVLGARVRGIATHAGPAAPRAAARRRADRRSREYERRVIRRLVGGARADRGRRQRRRARGARRGGRRAAAGTSCCWAGLRAQAPARGRRGARRRAGRSSSPAPTRARAEGLRPWEAAVAGAGARWLGEVSDPAPSRGCSATRPSLVHLSRAEVQSLAVIETLAHGTPVVLSDIPSHRELAAAYPARVRLRREPRRGPAARARAAHAAAAGPAAADPELGRRRAAARGHLPLARSREAARASRPSCPTPRRHRRRDAPVPAAARASSERGHEVAVVAPVTVAQTRGAAAARRRRAARTRAAAGRPGGRDAARARALAGRWPAGGARPGARAGRSRCSGRAARAGGAALDEQRARRRARRARLGRGLAARPAAAGCRGCSRSRTCRGSTTRAPRARPRMRPRATASRSRRGASCASTARTCPPTTS